MSDQKMHEFQNNFVNALELEQSSIDFETQNIQEIPV